MVSAIARSIRRWMIRSKLSPQQHSLQYFRQLLWARHCQRWKIQELTSRSWVRSANLSTNGSRSTRKRAETSKRKRVWLKDSFVSNSNTSNVTRWIYKTINSESMLTSKSYSKDSTKLFKMSNNEWMNLQSLSTVRYSTMATCKSHRPLTKTALAKIRQNYCLQM